MNCQAGHCVMLGDVAKRMVVSPDIWQLMTEGEAAQPQVRTGGAAAGGRTGKGRGKPEGCGGAVCQGM